MSSNSESSERGRGHISTADHRAAQSPAGRKPRASRSRSRGAGRNHEPQSGFTLIELIAVIIIIGGVLAVVLPRFTGLGVTYLKTDSKKMATLVRYLSDASATRHVYYRLRFDLDDDTVEVASSADGETFAVDTAPETRVALSRGVELADMEVEGLGRVDTGTVDFFFSPAGAAGAFTLRIKKEDRVMTLTFNPYSNRVVVGDGAR